MMTAADKKMADEFAEIQVEKNAGFMLIIKEMKAKADADKTKMRKLENEKEDESKLHFKCEQMKQEFKVLADKADERVQLLEKKNAQLQEDLERLDAENMLRMKDMMKDEMEIAHNMLEMLADDFAEIQVEKDAEFMLIIKAVQKKLADEFAENQVEKDAEFMLIIKEMMVKADDDKTKMMELQNKVNDLEKYDSRFKIGRDDLLIRKLETEKAEQENLRARIIATNRKCPKCAERMAALEVDEDSSSSETNN